MPTLALLLELVLRWPAVSAAAEFDFVFGPEGKVVASDEVGALDGDVRVFTHPSR